ncbi:MAG: hypothetical protein H7248_09210 [Microbacteriaceae bacterium]|nr:hypothetical protein [Microbacteriaceae bacterium]
MLTPSDAISLALELLTWLALVPGSVLLLIGLARRAWAKRFEETCGVVIASPAGTAHPWIRWLDLDRELQSAPIPLADAADHTIGDEVTVFFDPRNSENGRLDHPSTDGRVFRVTGIMLMAIGILAVLIQLILLLLE